MNKSNFGNTSFLMDISELTYGKKLPVNVKASVKYRQILSSIKNVNVIEPIVIYINNLSEKIVLDGHLRVEASKDLGLLNIPCLISENEESYSYNKYVSRLPVIQEYRMILQAVDAGVSEEKISQSLNISVETLRAKFRLLDGISPETIALLANQHVPQAIFAILRKMKAERQQEAVSTMMSINNFSRKFALSLLHYTPDDMLINPKDSKLKQQDIAKNFARMEREMAALEMETKQLETIYGTNNLKLAVIINHIKKLLSNYEILNWLVENNQDYLAQLKKIASIDSLPEPDDTLPT
ncbi:RepB plasmid partitioning protein [Salmonella enterica]|uniref:plasmid partitioning protein RepB C-terminal domain-containing protein n=1 Tax=Citrobacter freundii TaxID=546 RepID=UPI00127D98E9|nr:plasmid partitioning protein RepB C-terminal domain-containing protein [Citrobacter freundii]EAP7866536.1 RepB plasmid partitioning protein [Salmonella enterica]ECC9263609.1 RepB plasmid partitioning protein [Salmonella enterica subsp. diarizonae]EAQ1550006.1 RepB plasmid partitioning protein [Salmonella enterica]EAQ6245719.1 RepB plasmid partitioning protein [Salmonella enterica]EAS0547082.1 RepB plasmid partitioning protein [Salmonella enterica]